MRRGSIIRIRRTRGSPVALAGAFVALCSILAPVADASHANGPPTSHGHPVTRPIAFPVEAEAFVGNANLRYPFVDDFCVSRSYANPQCPTGTGHAGNDIYPYVQIRNRFRVVAPESGTIERVRCESGAGRLIRLRAFSGYGYKMLHLGDAFVAAGQTVWAGQPIARLSGTATAACTEGTSPHLHFELWAGAFDDGKVNLRCPYTSLTAAFARPGEIAHDLVQPTIADVFWNPNRGGGRDASGWPSVKGGGQWVHPWGRAGVQDYDGGSRGWSIILNSQWGTGQIYGVILGHYLDLGGAPAVGYPFDNGGGADEHTWGAGRVNDLTGEAPGAGIIMWKPTTGAWWIHGEIRNKFIRLGAWYRTPDEPMGFPVTDELEAARSPTGHTGRFNAFETGAILWDRNTGRAWEVHGAIKARYDALHGSGSVVGFPVSDEHSHFNTACVCWAPASAFERGCITWTGSTWDWGYWGSRLCGYAHGHGEGPNG